MSDRIKGSALTMGGAACWGVSGCMGQYLFTREGMDSTWLVPIRLFLAGRLVRAGTALRGSAAGVPSRMPQTALSMTTAAKSPSSAAHSGMVPEAAALTITPPSRRDAVTASLQNLCLMSSQFIPLPPKEPAPQWPAAANSTTDNSVPFVVLTIIHL